MANDDGMDEAALDATRSVSGGRVPFVPQSVEEFQLLIRERTQAEMKALATGSRAQRTLVRLLTGELFLSGEPPLKVDTVCVLYALEAWCGKFRPGNLTIEERFGPRLLKENDLITKEPT